MTTSPNACDQVNLRRSIQKSTKTRIRSGYQRITALQVLNAPVQQTIPHVLQTGLLPAPFHAHTAIIYEPMVDRLANQFANERGVSVRIGGYAMGQQIWI